MSQEKPQSPIHQDEEKIEPKHRTLFKTALLTGSAMFGGLSNASNRPAVLACWAVRLVLVHQPPSQQ